MAGGEDPFRGFAIKALSVMGDDRLEALRSDKRVTRSGPKMPTIRGNAAFRRLVSGFARQGGCWPLQDFAGLVLWLQRNASRLNDKTAPCMLRHMDKGGRIPSQDVGAQMKAGGLIEEASTLPAGWQAVRSAFSIWQAESGQSLTTISLVLAQSVG